MRLVAGSRTTTGKPILATDVTQDPDWQPNHFLPNTRGELAVPIKLGEQVLGILDVQSDQAGALWDFPPRDGHSWDLPVADSGPTGHAWKATVIVRRRRASISSQNLRTLDF